MSAPLKRTPLAEEHIASGARMVDFGGWDMPLAYGSQLEEHHAVRQDAGMFDVSHMLNADVTGPDAYAFLQRLVANDVAKLTVPGKALYTCMLNPQGGVIDDLIVYFFALDEWRVVVNAGTADKDMAWMQRVKQAGKFDVTITPRRDLAMIAVQGPNARAKVWAARPAWQAASEPLTPFVAARVGDDTLVARTGYTGEDGFEIVLPAAEAVQLWRDLAAQGVRPAGLGARDTLRLEAGMNLYGQDMDELTQPGEAADLDGVPEEPRAPLHRPRRAGAVRHARRLRRPEAAGTRRDARPHGGAHRAGRGRAHQRHHVADAGRVDRLCPPAARRGRGRHGRGRHPRQVGARPGLQAAVCP